MKAWYSIRVGSRLCIADIMSWGGNTYTINRINVPKPLRGQGYGRALLKQILEDADKEQATLVLIPEATGGLTQYDLEGWYVRNGFWFTDQEYMQRDPHLPTAAS